MRPEFDEKAVMKGEGGSLSWLNSGFRQRYRAAATGALYHTGLLRMALRWEGTHQLCSVPGSSWPRLRRFTGSKFAILCYHRVGTEGVPLFSRLRPDAFERQMRYVRKHYRVVPLGQLCRELEEAVPVKPTVAITFDDGYRDLYSYAFPVLRKYEIPATIYLIGKSMQTGEAPWYDRIFVALHSAAEWELEVEMGEPRRFTLSGAASRAAAAWEIICYLRSIPDTPRRKWCAAFEARMKVSREMLEYRMLDWEQVREMRRSGVSFGAHTMNHPAVSRLDEAELEEELGRSKRDLEAGLGATVEDFAYPFGKAEDRSDSAENYLLRCGYRSAVTTTAGVNSRGQNRFALHRLQIGDGSFLADFAFRLSQMFFEASDEAAPAPVQSLSKPAQQAETSERVS